ncbi:MAG: cyclodeaminase/cyclohydrolase family protein [Phycisphaerales bacterium]|nr:cyclodeaminase/cyclohydrolase family protein [Phycisphaerales bacterium]
MSNQTTTDTTTDPSSSLADQTIAGYLGALNSKSPTPGGGAVAGTCGATGAAVAGMVVHYTLGKKKYAEHETANAKHLETLSAAQRAFLTLADDDARGYGELNSLWSLPESDPVRKERWSAAVAGAIAPPKQMLSLCVEVMSVIEGLVETTNTQLKSDLAVAAHTIRGAAHSAACNIRINVPLLEESQQQDVLEDSARKLSIIDTLCERIEGLTQ